MKLHYEILDKGRLAIFKKLSAFSRDSFLAGGTALALQLGHRISYDFDSFCYKPITLGLISRVKNFFPIKEVVRNNIEEFTFWTKEDVKLTFFHYPFKFPGKLIETSEGVPLLSVKNIAVAKAYTLNMRAQYRDYVDIFCILKAKNLALKDLIKESKKVYGKLFSEKLFLGQLVYLEDLSPSDINGIKFLGESCTFSDLKNFFKVEVEKYRKKIVN